MTKKQTWSVLISIRRHAKYWNLTTTCGFLQQDSPYRASLMPTTEEMMSNEMPTHRTRLEIPAIVLSLPVVGKQLAINNYKKSLQQRMVPRATEQSSQCCLFFPHLKLHEVPEWSYSCKARCSLPVLQSTGLLPSFLEIRIYTEGGSNSCTCMTIVSDNQLTAFSHELVEQ